MNLDLDPKWRENLAFVVIILLTICGLAAVYSAVTWGFEGHITNQMPWGAEFGTWFFTTSFAVLSGALRFLLRKDEPIERLTDDQQARADLIANQQNAHIDGVLEKRLFEQVRIALGLTDMPDMLQRSLTSRLGQQRQTLPDGTLILDLYRRGGRKLLILGQPGAGKTTLVLELLRDLLTRASADDKAQIPVYLNLSNWAASEPEIGAWVRERMVAEYAIAKKVSEQWIVQDRLVLLLDGLDEVDYTRRAECVEAINTFVSAHTLPLVVCSRTNDYDMLQSKLNLAQAVEIAPLTSEQIEAYLTEPRLKLQGVHQMVLEDAELAELAETPLMLSFIAMAYRGISVGQLHCTIAEQTDRRRQLLNRFIVRQLQDNSRTSETEQQSDIQTRLNWLRFLAQQLERQHFQQYFVDEMQPDWLGLDSLMTYRKTIGQIVGLTFGLAGWLGFGLIFKLYFGLVDGLVYGLLSGIGFGMGTWLAVGLSSTSISRVEVISWQYPTLRDVLQLLLLAVLQGCALLVGGYLNRLYGTGWAAGGTFLVMFGAWLLYDGLVHTLGVGLIRGLMFGFGIGFSFGRVGGVGIGLVFSLIIGLYIGLPIILHAQSSTRRIVPNQGIRMAGRMAVLVAFTLTVGISLVARIGFGVGEELGVGLGVGLLFGLYFGLNNYGGKEVIQHYILRWMLGQRGLFPRIRDLIPFLNAMARRILLVHAGAHYRFVHRTLQEHFADLSDRELEALAKEIDGL